MLLRLLPTSNPSQPTPPTILFTLPMPTHPYTSKSLPLPLNLLAHRSVCLQEDIDCPNVLMGEKSSWISGIVDDVTFSLPAQSITVNFIDGTAVTLPLAEECVGALQRVIKEVQLSFAPPEPTPRTSISSIASVSSTSSTSSTRRSPSALLLSLLSPLLAAQSSPQPITPPAPVQPPARIHRRAARSLLVDTYRRHVLPALREHLPSAYLPWVISSETSRKSITYESLRDEIRQTLAAAGVNELPRRCPSSSSSDSDSDSDSDVTPSPITPATSIFSRSQCSSPVQRTPQNFLLSLPPPHAISTSHRAKYTTQLTEITKLSTRLQAIKKLSARYEREEGKRRWLEGLERGRAGDRALRRAFVNGELKKGSSVPIKRSRLFMSTTMVDEIVHPAMESVSESYESSAIESDSESELDDSIPLTPTSVRHSARMTTPPLDPEDDLRVQDKIILVRPPMTHHDEHYPPTTYEDDTPSLTTSTSGESLSSNEEWDTEGEKQMPPSALKPWTGLPLGKRIAPPLPPRPKTKKLVDWADKVQVVIVGNDVFTDTQEGDEEEEYA